MNLKICGMKYKENILEVAAKLQPDYLGFVFHKESSRFFEGNIPNLPESIKKIGVFVDISMASILEKIEQHGLHLIQLHGSESPKFCEAMCDAKAVSVSHKNIKIIKAFSISKNFNFDQLKAYEDVSDYFLFDTLGKFPGGNGHSFNWEALKHYPSKKPYFLSGGIGLDKIADLNEFLQKEESQYCHAIDINSQFEMEPGLKDVEKLIEFKSQL